MKIKFYNEDHYTAWFWCPGCNKAHPYRVKPYPGETCGVWQFNGNMEKPTFSPSLLVYEYIVPGTGKVYQPRCHLFLTDGVIMFLGDCNHALRGQSVPLPEWPTSGPAEE